MNLSEPFIRRPVATTLTMIGVVLFGALAYPQLPVDDVQLRPRQHEHHAPVRLEPQHRCRGAGRAGGDLADAAPAAAGHPAALVPEVEPRRLADPIPGAHLGPAAALDAGRVRADDAR